MSKEPFYITTAIDYVNAEPHIGHAYQKIVADALARWHTLLGKEVFFLTGTDEYGKKLAQTAEKAGKKPKELVDEMSEKFKHAWKLLNIQYDRFIRTTDEDHHAIVHEFIKKCEANGDIYKDKYEGLYCIGCEAYYTEKDVPDLVCPIHEKPLETIKEESYFFRLSKYQDFLLDLYEKHPEFVQPTSRRNEITNRVKEGLKDLSITRTSFDWGIPFPLEEGHVTYVWFDALINYYSATRKEENLNKFWPANLHLLGKDNTWFHTVYWPAMLKSAGIDLPTTTFNHGFLTVNGKKISKSLGNSGAVTEFVEKYGADTVRYLALRQFPFASGDDGDFNEESIVARHNGELADKLGNLVSRVCALAEKYGLEVTKQSLDVTATYEKVAAHMEKYEPDKALNEIFAYIDKCNEYIQDTKPWETKDSKVLFELADAIKNATILLSPFIPETAEKIAETFKFKLTLEDLNKPLSVQEVKKPEPLFKKL